VKKKIQSDLNQALKNKREIEVSTLRLLLSEIHNQEIANKAELTEEEIVRIIQKEVKKRKEAIEAYQKGKRDDLVAKERQELAILSKYLPQQLPPQELEAIVQSTIEEIKAMGMSDFGKVMGAVMAKAKGKADGKAVSEAVKKALGS